MFNTRLLLATAAFGFSACFADADPITAQSGNQTDAAFDIVAAKIAKQGDSLVFSVAVASAAGASKPTANGKLEGANVYSYVWPTTLDSSAVGFDAKQGILALAVTAHPDFDDTPAADENSDGDMRNDGGVWHSHWVVLGPDEACGKGALKVIDIPPGATPKLPATWPGLPLLIDSPALAPAIDATTVAVTVPLASLGGAADFKFDGVTAGLRVNEQAHAPLLCVVNVFDVASGDLSLPGTVSE
jgi:hypothetical protein